MLREATNTNGEATTYLEPLTNFVSKWLNVPNGPTRAGCPRMEIQKPKSQNRDTPKCPARSSLCSSVSAATRSAASSGSSCVRSTAYPQMVRSCVAPISPPSTTTSFYTWSLTYCLTYLCRYITRVCCQWG